MSKKDKKPSDKARAARKAAAVPWGLYDTKDAVWLGDEAGPRLYDDYFLARVAARVADVQLGQPAGRTEARRYRAKADRLRDRKPTVMSPLTALTLLEEGKVL